MDILEKLENRLQLLNESVYADSLESLTVKELQNELKDIEKEIQKSENEFDELNKTEKKTNKGRKVKNQLDKLFSQLDFVEIELNIRDKKKFPLNKNLNDKKDEVIKGREKKSTKDDGLEDYPRDDKPDTDDGLEDSPRDGRPDTNKKPETTPQSKPDTNKKPETTPQSKPDNADKKKKKDKSVDSSIGMGSVISSTLENIFKDPKHRKNHIEDLKDELKDLQNDRVELLKKLQKLKSNTNDEDPMNDPESEDENTTDDPNPNNTSKPKGNSQELKTLIAKWLAQRKNFKEVQRSHADATSVIDKKKQSGTEDPSLSKAEEEINKIFNVAKQKWILYKKKEKIGKGQEYENLYKKALSTNESVVYEEKPRPKNRSKKNMDTIDSIKSQLRKNKQRIIEIKQELLKAKFWILTTIKRINDNLGLVR